MIAAVKHKSIPSVLNISQDKQFFLTPSILCIYIANLGKKHSFLLQIGVQAFKLLIFSNKPLLSFIFSSRPDAVAATITYHTQSNSDIATTASNH